MRLCSYSHETICARIVARTAVDLPSWIGYTMCILEPIYPFAWCGYFGLPSLLRSNSMAFGLCVLIPRSNCIVLLRLPADGALCVKRRQSCCASTLYCRSLVYTPGDTFISESFHSVARRAARRVSLPSILEAHELLAKHASWHVYMTVVRETTRVHFV